MNNKNRRSYAYKFLLVIALLVGSVSAVQPSVYAKSVPYMDRYDINSYTGKRTRVSSKSRSVPNNAYWAYTTTNVIKNGWNYTRYISIFHYYDGKTKKYYH
ncbi:hypothetical protein HCJ39_14135 [Listeria rocourtiae]|uniref:Lactococcin 972 family bacteriocin n=1 Tax=Listeria rocourtiae TaxID=647910 RepID=A0A4R6ZEZ0_9LIST|nr:hypothetical protein [Listeria rocourtiae]EUJ48932.1 hypothetical protein PROCOU_05128 [Listeria rocourtiae FSL F6-920]MBC1436189.1 hypothetical protein [Listeria rocourtiae]MBC1605852.1 hypothetical protein [Listeria rocourtiae]TDR50690.1 hypothetical protein DFP96_11813 [Listeria rocourtiae]